MKADIRWTEVVDYRSLINIDQAEWDEFWAGVLEAQPDAVLSAEWVKEFLEEGDESDWFEKCDTSRDFEGVSDRHINEVELA